MRKERRSFDGKIYDLFYEEPTEILAKKEGNKLLRSGWATHIKIVKTSNKEDKLPYKVWSYIDPQMTWNKYKTRVLSECDKDVKSIIRDLNDNKQFTVESCSGHHERPGLIWFDKRTANENKIIDIMKKHGLRNIRRRNQFGDSNHQTVLYQFDLPGTEKPKYIKIVKKKKVVKKKSVGFSIL